MMHRDDNILVCGARGMVGSAFHRKLVERGFDRVFAPSREELDLRNKEHTYKYIKNNKIDTVILAAALVGGIKANEDYPYDFLIQNLEIQNSVISSSHELDVRNFMFLGSSCIYPRLAKQPISEDELLASKLEETNESYAIAKISGIKLIDSVNKQFKRAYMSIMPCNLYGLNDYYHPTKSHVIPSLMRRLHFAKVKEKPFVEIWGSGTPKREFLFADDLADAGLFLLQHQKKSIGMINVGCGVDISIRDLASEIKKIVDYQGALRFNTEFPDGTPQKLLDVQRIKKMGWSPKTKLSMGLAAVYSDFVKNIEGIRQ